MICYSCNRRVGTQWVDVCPYCGNKQIAAQNMEMRAKIERFLNPPAENDDASVRRRPMVKCRCYPPYGWKLALVGLVLCLVVAGWLHL